MSSPGEGKKVTFKDPASAALVAAQLSVAVLSGIGLQTSALVGPVSQVATLGGRCEMALGVFGRLFAALYSPDPDPPAAMVSRRPPYPDSGCPQDAIWRGPPSPN